MKTLFLATMIAAAGIASARDAVLSTWETAYYSTHLQMPSYFNDDCGLLNLTFKGKSLFGATGIVIPDWCTLDKAAYKTKPSEKYETEVQGGKLIVVFEKEMIKSGKEEEGIFGKVAKRLTLSESEIVVDVTVTLLQEIKYLNWVSWLCKDYIAPVKGLKQFNGWTFEGIRSDQSVANVYIDTERSFDAGMWRSTAGSGVYREYVFSHSGVRMIFRALKSCGLRAERHSADAFGLRIIHLRKDHDSRPFSIPAGGKMEFSYSITFER